MDALLLLIYVWIWKAEIKKFAADCIAEGIRRSAPSKAGRE